MFSFVPWRTKCRGVFHESVAGRKGKSSAHEKTGEEYPSNSMKIVLKDILDNVTPDALPFYSFQRISRATNHFDEGCVLNKADFGVVYKGKMPDGKEIAVKWLPRASAQRLEEFRNEVVISKLQHRNVVSLIGCCVEKQEILLIHEFMVNRTVEYALFEQSQVTVDWGKRFNIIKGIGRGLLYLHQDSRLRIIHGNLKMSNVLLDESWEPKISHFGMARILEGREDQTNTDVIEATKYMVPECAMGGVLSEKTDIFSFGFMILEIISGKRCTSFFDVDGMTLSFLEHVWKSWNEGSLEDIIDKRMHSLGFRVEMIRCIHIGLLCVQEFPTDRPTISKVLFMIGNQAAVLPLPQQPAFRQIDAKTV